MEQTITAKPQTTTLQQVFQRLREHLNNRIIGQELLIQRLLIALIAKGHLLVEGAPGLAKTTAIKELAACIEGSFHRIQFTPDLLPADLTGTDIFRPHNGSDGGTFSFLEGPIFHNLVLADEINRAPAKVQSALLEAMAEHQVSVGRYTYALPDLFLVMATQNPIEQEGTYPLPEAQLDRFLMYIKVDYPSVAAEQMILQLNREQARKPGIMNKLTTPKVSQEHVFAARRELWQMHLSPALEEYIVQLVIATRKPEPYGKDLTKWLRYGASPRGTLGIDACARANAWLQGRDYVSPEDVIAVVEPVLCHRILLTFEAEAEGITPEHVIRELLNRIAVP